MSAVKQKDTEPELMLRKAIWARGLRFRKNYKVLIGKPDIVFTKAKVVVFCDGDFWHGHNWALRGLPSLEAELATYSEFWKQKILRNIERDKEVTDMLAICLEQIYNSRSFQNGHPRLRGRLILADLICNVAVVNNLSGPRSNGDHEASEVIQILDGCQFTHVSLKIGFHIAGEKHAPFYFRILQCGIPAPMNSLPEICWHGDALTALFDVIHRRNERKSERVAINLALGQGCEFNNLIIIIVRVLRGKIYNNFMENQNCVPDFRALYELFFYSFGKNFGK